MSLTNTKVSECCETAPIWMFLYSDGSIFAVCDDHYNSPSYRVGLKTIINIKTKQEMPILALEKRESGE